MSVQVFEDDLSKENFEIVVHYKQGTTNQPLIIPATYSDDKKNKVSLKSANSLSLSRNSKFPFSAFISAVHSICPSLSFSGAYVAFYLDKTLPGKLLFVGKECEDMTELLLQNRIWRISAANTVYSAMVSIANISSKQPQSAKTEPFNLQYSRHLLVNDAIFQSLAYFDLLFASENTQNRDIFSMEIPHITFDTDQLEKSKLQLNTPQLTPFYSSSFNLLQQSPRFTRFLDQNELLCKYDLTSECSLKLVWVSDIVNTSVKINADAFGPYKTKQKSTTEISMNVCRSFDAQYYLGLVRYELENKKVELIGKLDWYSCWILGQELWIDSIRSLEHACKTTSDLNMEMRPKMVPINVFEAYSSTNSCALVSNNCTVAELLATIALDDPNVFTSASAAYLSTKLGCSLGADERVWDLVEEIKLPEIGQSNRVGLEYMPEYGRISSEIVYKSSGLYQVQLTTSADAKASIVTALDSSIRIQQLMPTILRRVGLHKTHAKSLRIVKNESNDALEISVDSQRTLSELAIRPMDRIVINLDKGLWLLDATKIMGSDVKNKRVEVDETVWTQGPDGPHNIVYDKNDNIVAATLGKLVEKMTPEIITRPEQYQTQLNAFLLTLETFTTPMEVFKLMWTRYQVPRLPTQSILQFDSTRKRIQARVAKVLEKWVLEYSKCFYLASEAAKKMIQFAETELVQDHLQMIGKSIKRGLQHVLECEIQEKHPEDDERIEQSSFGGKIFEFAPEMVAQQMSKYFFEQYAAIRPEEMLNQNWTRAEADRLSPNISNLSKRFNSLVRWLIVMLLNTRDIAMRAARMEWLAEVTVMLYQQRNYLITMAFLAGLSNAAVSRLKHTRARVSARIQRKLEEVEDEMKPKMSFKQYRAVLRTEGDARIPYIMAHLGDLVYIEDGNPDKHKHMINFSKRQQIYAVIAQVLQYQERGYEQTTITEVRNMIERISRNQSVVGSEEQLYQRSLELEPRGWDGVTRRKE